MLYTFYMSADECLLRLSCVLPCTPTFRQLECRMYLMSWPLSQQNCLQFGNVICRRQAREQATQMYDNSYGQQY